MTAQEFLKSKEPNVFIIPEEWLEEYANIVLSVAAEKATASEYWGDCIAEPKLIVDRDSILNCLKD